jgi:hypothetical protein
LQVIDSEANPASFVEFEVKRQIADGGASLSDSDRLVVAEGHCERASILGAIKACRSVVRCARAASSDQPSQRDRSRYRNTAAGIHALHPSEVEVNSNEQRWQTCEEKNPISLPVLHQA